MLARKREAEISTGWASLIGLAQFGVLGINAASRQVVQHLEFGPYFDIWKQPTATQWAPLLIFLVAFVLGLGAGGVDDLPGMETPSRVGYRLTSITLRANARQSKTRC